MIRLIRNHSIKRLLLTAIVSILIICFHKPPLEPVASAAKPVNNTHASVAVVTPVVAPDLTKFDLANPATWPTCPDDEWHWADDGQCHKKPVAPPQTAAPVRSGDCNQYRAILAQYSWNVDVAVNVCNAESGGFAGNDNPGDGHATCMGSRGLFQIGCDSTNNYAGMFDAGANIAQAHALYANRGWQPWGFTTCKYKVACY